ncbi:16S rRNA (uracil(1498)-N(3))-methyltransferase [Anaplasma phagocytophilum]|uniref:16S rRNA (uracil(1498)-N(3))-methyltransferase n=1 Tax=Anaplasma phagocytophilum TaxID=948 RepID=UPI00201A4D47
MVFKKKPVKIRLYYSDSALNKGEKVVLRSDQAHYIRDVMRARISDAVVLFDGVTGDWFSTISEISRKEVKVRVEYLVSEYVKSRDLMLCIALVKQDTMRSVVRQATEMGVTQIQPIRTEYSVVSDINVQKCRQWALEAAEQCKRHDIPEIASVMEFARLNNLGKELVLCDETGKGRMPAEVLCGKENLGIIIGPEGGFSERELVCAESFCEKMSLGHRIFRVDTAVVAALAYVNEHYIS